MATATDFPTAGKVIASTGDVVVFVPRGTNYELLLQCAGEPPALHAPVRAIIRATGRKLWTVPSGGNFIVPIMGPPQIIQGRVKYADEQQLVVRAGANVIVELPRAESAVDLPNGVIAVGGMVNVTIMPGASVEFVEAAVAQG